MRSGLCSNLMGRKFTFLKCGSLGEFLECFEREVGKLVRMLVKINSKIYFCRIFKRKCGEPF